MRTLALLLILLCFTPQIAWAEQQDTPENSEDQTVCTTSPSNLQGIVEELSGQISRLIADLPLPRSDLALVVRSTLPSKTGSGPQLSPTITELLIAHISRNHPLRSVREPSQTNWSTESQARSGAASSGFELLVWLELSIENNHLIAQGTVYETERHLWKEAVSPERQVLGQIFSRRRVNAELRFYLPPIPPGPLSMTSIPLEGFSQVLALSVADLDGDDINELVLLNQRALEVHRMLKGQTGQITQITRLKLSGMPRAVTRSRDIIGSLAIGPPDQQGQRPIALRTSDFSKGIIVRFDGQELSLKGTVNDFPIRWEDELECVTQAPGKSHFQTARAPCGSLGASSLVTPYSWAGENLIEQPNKRQPGNISAIVTTKGLVTVRWNKRLVAKVGSYGTALAIADVNDDGQAEVLLSSNRLPGTGDVLTVLRISPDGMSPEREKLRDIPGSVWVASSGDVDNDGLTELLAISHARSGSQLLVIEPGTGPGESL